jgi:hypothetical protein
LDKMCSLWLACCPRFSRTEWHGGRLGDDDGRAVVALQRRCSPMRETTGFKSSPA